MIKGVAGSGSSKNKNTSSGRKGTGIKLSIGGSSSSSKGGGGLIKGAGNKGGSSSSGGLIRPKGTGGSASSGWSGSSSKTKKTSGTSGGLIKGVRTNQGGYSARPGASSGYRPNTSPNRLITGGLSNGSRGTGGNSVRTRVAGAYVSNNSPAIPRYEAPGFRPISTPNSSGLIKGYYGAKLGKDGVIRYPSHVEIDPLKAVRNQAYVDYAYGETASGNSRMGDIYGQPYYDELERLANLPAGAPAWGYDPPKNKPDSNRGHDDGYGGGGSGGGGFGGFDEYAAIIKAAWEAAQDALKGQTDQTVSDIYAGKGLLNDEYKKAAQQLYINYMQGLNQVPQALAAQGLTGGASESANVALQTNYNGGLSNLASTYQQGLAQLEQEAANARITGNGNQSQILSQFLQLLANAVFEAASSQADFRARQQLALLK